MKKKIVILVSLITLIVVITIILRRKAEFLYAGVIEATRIDISARVSSIVASKEITEGARVKKGEILYRLSGEEIRILAGSAESDFKRAERLYKMRSISLEAYEHAKNRFDEASLKLKWCNIETPIDGIVLTTYREIGEWVSPGTRLVTVANLEEVWTFIYVEQPMLSKLSIGQKVQGILPEMKDKIFTGSIVKISSEAEFTPKNVQTRDERTRLVYGIKIAFPNKEEILKPGMIIEVKL